MQYLCLDHDSNAVVASHFKWKEHKVLFCLYEEIYLICITYLFDLGIVLKFQFSFVIDIIFKCCYLAEVFIKRLTNEEHRSNQNQQKSNNMQ